METEDNPTDEASSGASPWQLMHNSHWLKGPPFLLKQTVTYQDEAEQTLTLSPDDPELKKTQVFSTSRVQSQEMASVLKRLEYFSDWSHAIKAIAICLRLRYHTQTTSSENKPAAKTS